MGIGIGMGVGMVGVVIRRGWGGVILKASVTEGVDAFLALFVLEQALQLTVEGSRQEAHCP